MLDLSIGGHDDCSTKLFGSQIPCYGSQWLLTGRYFKYWALLHSVSYFFFLYWSCSLSLSQVFDAISSNIDEVLLINLSANMFVFVDLNVHHKDWLNYSGGTDRPRELCYSFLSTLLQWLTFIIRSLPGTILIIFLSQFPLTFCQNQKQDAPFHHIAQYYSQADWGDHHNHLRDVPWEYIFKFGVFAARGFCE